MITLQVSRRAIKMQTFGKLIEELKDPASSARIRIISAQLETPDAFLKVMWSGAAGILLQNETDKQFVAIDDVYAIDSFEINTSVMTFKAHKEYFLR